MITTLKQFLSYLATDRECSPHTLNGYGLILVQFAVWCEANAVATLADLGRDKLREYIRSREANKPHRIAVMKSFIKWAAGEGLMPDLREQIVTPKSVDRLPRTIPKEDLDRLLAPVSPETVTTLGDQLILELGYGSGLRLCEICSLRLDRISIADRMVCVIGKGNKERIVPMTPATVDAIGHWLERGRCKLPDLDSPLLLINRFGHPMTSKAIQLRLHDRARKAGVLRNITPHMMRHSFATCILEGGGDLEAIRDMMGHKSISTTQVYTSCNGARLRAVHEQCHPRNTHETKTQTAIHAAA